MMYPNLLKINKRQITLQLLTNSIIIGLLATLNTTVLAQNQNTPLPTQSQPGNTNVNQKLLGQWKAKASSSSETLIFIFTPQGKLFSLPSSSSTPVALEFRYRINPNTKPMQLDVTIPTSAEPILTIFEFLADGKMRLQLHDTNPGQPRPKAFYPNAIIFEKISDATTLPENVQVFNGEPENQASSNPTMEGEVIITAMNRTQQAYYLENNKFATKIEQLAIATKLETDNYQYKILPQGKLTSRVMMTATAKSPESKSYTGAVFVTKVNGESLTIAGICETNNPSKIPPTMVKFIPGKEGGQIQCPAGSSLLR
ncbi:type IV pilin-like G/H family protein [Plectonema radiosum NIES-515]|uniref:Type IV pilin-like G/H family protein n=1 Tax=Plectonema radiosum NIES-515 TaxID=2986073 RepID=A0ABT3B8K8_9CYAN|nr:type IV pilin-like G/H family protein [Plectonema radiosum]MCV3217254.1 type IV pilin-like G/H family protein [Plectonema radiosum NIES-515]